MIRPAPRCAPRARLPDAGAGRTALKLHVIAWGRIGRGPESELVERYLRRIQWPTQVTELGEGAALPPAPPNSRTVALDERAAPLTSRDFARHLERFRDSGARETRFLIGPADGHAGTTREAADLLLGFGALTWPHLLARAMLAEQLYRATSLLAGHPYHRD